MNLSDQFNKFMKLKINTRISKLMVKGKFIVPVWFRFDLGCSYYIVFRKRISQKNIVEILKISERHFFCTCVSFVAEERGFWCVRLSTCSTSVSLIFFSAFSFVSNDT